MSRTLFTVFSMLLLGYSRVVAATDSTGNTVIKRLKYISPEKMGSGPYLDTVTDLMRISLTSGQYCPKDSLIKYLEPFRKLVWDNPQFLNEKIDYFKFLTDNSILQKRGGEANYFTEKMEDEMRKQGVKKSLWGAIQRCVFFSDNELNATIYEKERKYLDSVPILINSGNIASDEVLDAFYLLQPIATSFYNLRDTLNAQYVLKQVLTIRHALSSKKLVSKSNLFFCDFLIHCIEFNQPVAPAIRRNALAKMAEQIASAEAPEWQPYLQFSYADYRVAYFISVSPDPDSAIISLRKLEHVTPVVDNHSFRAGINNYRYQIWKMQSKDKQAGSLIDDLLNSKDTLNKDLSRQLNDLLYTHTKAEDTATELMEAEREKQRRAVIIIIITVVAITTIIAVYLWMRRRNREVRAQVDTVNEIINLKIAALEEARHQAVKEEHERMARELHDDFSAAVAGVKYNLDDLVTLVTDKILKTKLEKLHGQIELIYDTARNKSHLWYQEANVMEETSFTSSINFLIDQALPDSRYKNDIQIEAEAVRLLSRDDRINILRIIQESITNCIKHSKCNEVSIFLYQTDDHIHLQISDNGIGIYNSRKKENVTYGLGMKSILKRVESLHGEMEVFSEGGTTLLISFRKHQAPIRELVIPVQTT